MPDRYRFRDRLPKPGEGKNPRAEIAPAAIDGTTAKLYLYDVIDDWGGFWGVSASEFAEALNDLSSDVDTIELHINSPGGIVYEAIAIKNLLAAHPAKVVAVVDGLAASAASFIATAADETVMGENTELMIHDAHTIARANAAGFRMLADDLDRVSDNIASIYAKKSGGTVADWRASMTAPPDGTWYSAEEAVEAGLADRVGSVSDAASDSTLERQRAVALSVIRGEQPTQWAPGGVTAPAAVATSTTPEEKHEHQTETAPSGTAASGAQRSEDNPTNSDASQEEVMRMSIEEREARIAEINSRLTDINADNAGDILQPDDQAEWDSLVAERGQHETAIEAQQRRTAELEAAAGNPGATESAEQVTDRSTTLGRTAAAAGRAPAVHIKPEDVFDASAIRANARSVDDLGRRYHDHAKRAVEISRFPGATSREDAQAHVTKLLDKFAEEKDSVLAQRVINTGSPVYDRAFGKAVKAMNTGGLNPEELRALTLGTDSEGGYAVPFQLDPTVILTSDGSQSDLRQIARVVQITGKKWEGLTSAGITVTRKGETDEATDDSPSFDQPVVETSRADGFVPFSIALELAWTELRDELTMMLAEAKADEEAVSFVTGAGTALTTGGVLPQGILTGLSAATTTHVVTGSTGAIARTDLYKVKSALPERFRGNTQWFAADTFYDQARGLETTGDTTPITEDTVPRLLGRPAYTGSAMPDYSTTSSSNLAIYGNIARTFLIVDRIGMNVELIPHLVGTNRRPTGQRGIFAYWFNGSKVVNPAASRLLRMK